MKFKFIIKLIIVIIGLILIGELISTIYDNVQDEKAVEMARDLCFDINNPDKWNNSESTSFFDNNKYLLVPALIKILNDEDNQIKINAISLLVQQKDSRIVMPIANLLQDDNWKVRFYAANALGLVGDKRAVDPLLKRWNEEDVEYVQQNIVVALIKIGDRKIIPTFRDVYQNDDKRRLSAAMVLYEFQKDDTYLKFIEEEIKNLNSSKRLLLIASIGKLKDPDLIPLLKKYLNDEDEKVRKYAQQSIDEIKNITPR